jgi:Capsular polysaccharide synthesis protein
MKIGSASAITFSSPLGDKIDPTHLSEFKQYTIRAIESTVPGEKPFRHLYIEHVLPHVLYTAVRSRMFQHKYNSALLDRTQDSDQFVNKRFSLVKNEDIETQYLRAIFSDNAVKSAFLQHFFLDVTPEFAASLEIHTEFEYMYTAAGRSQNIHVDIPPKFLSFVFYFPEFEVDTDAERLNATVFYDKHLNPQYVARYRPNSLCVFAPHFYSYHGFASTIDREVLVMFYVNAAEMNHWVETRNIESPPFQAIRKAIDDKLRRFSLIEYGLDPVKLDIERRDCLINAPRGRVMKANDKSHVSKTDRYRSVSNITTTAKSESQKYSLNKVVWICWLQGWDRAPWLVRKCLASWQWRNPDWEIRALDSNLLQRYVELPSLEGKIITPASMSDIIRSLLLHEYGGIWVDATVLCHRPLDTWIWDVTPEGFFAFDRPGPDRLLSSWFIAAAEGNLLMDRWHASVVNFWEANDQTDNYFWFHYLFADLCKSDPQFNEQWNLVPKISAIDPHRFQSIGLLEDRDEVIEKALISPPAVSKLTYRYNETARNDKSLATKLMQDFPGPFLPKSTANKVGIVNLKPIASLSVSTQNLGDHMQILAARRLIERASRRPCLYADRDNDILSCSTLPTAYGPYPILINGWFKPTFRS